MPSEKNGFIPLQTNRFPLSAVDEKAVFFERWRTKVRRARKNGFIATAGKGKAPDRSRGLFFNLISQLQIRLNELIFNKTCFLVDVTEAENVLVMESLILNVDYAVGTEVCCLNLVCAIFVSAVD